MATLEYERLLSPPSVLSHRGLLSVPFRQSCIARPALAMADRTLAGHLSAVATHNTPRLLFLH